MTQGSTQEWYALLEKPWFAPPAWVFGPVWSVLYILIIISFDFVFLNVIRKRWPAKTAVPFAINLAVNLLFTPLQFVLRNNVLALFDIIIVLATVVWMQLPYALWVSFACVLQISITWLNL